MIKNLYTALFLLIMSSCYTSKEVNNAALLYYGKTRCLGKCPVLDMYIYEDGKVVYEGFENVSLLGKKEFTLSKDDINFLKNELNKTDFRDSNKLKRDLPNTILKYKNQKLIVQNKEEIKTLLDFLEKVTP